MLLRWTVHAIPNYRPAGRFHAAQEASLDVSFRSISLRADLNLEVTDLGIFVRFTFPGH